MPWIVAAIVAVLAVAAAAFLLRSRRLPRTKRGMKEWARDPALRRGMSRAFDERNALIARAGDLSDEEIRAGLEQVLAEERNAPGTWMQVCEQLGPRAAPLIIEALGDPRGAPAEAKPGFGAAVPFNALTDMLARTGSEATVDQLQSLLTSPHEHIRTQAVFCIAMSGCPAAVGPVVAALADENGRIRSYAMIGAGRAAGSGRISPPFQRAVAAALAPIVAGETPFNEFEDLKAPQTLMAIDQERALTWLASPRCLRADNPQLAGVLDQLNSAGAHLPVDALNSLIDAMDRAGDHSGKRARGSAFVALARADPGAVAGRVERELASDDAAARAAAAEALLTMHDLPDPYKLWGAEDGHGGFDALPRPVQHVIATVEFEAEVNNGGLSQYFFNSAGDHWPVAMEAFKAMNCPVCEDILRSAAGAIPKGPSPNREKRIKQYGRLTDEQEKPLDELSSRFYADEDRLNVQRAVYMVEHADMIRGLTAREDARA